MWPIYWCRTWQASQVTSECWIQVNILAGSMQLYIPPWPFGLPPGVYKYNAGHAWSWRSHTFIDECTPRLQVNTISFGNAKRRRLTCGDKTKTFSFLEISIYWMILKSQNLSHHYFTTLLNYRCNLRGTAPPTKN